MPAFPQNKLPVIVGVSGTELTHEERDFFEVCPPAGFILFARNIVSESQVITLTSSLKKIAGQNIPILIDEEGGYVSRLKQLGSFYETPEVRCFELSDHAEDTCAQQYKTISEWLLKLGITVNCAPVMDVRTQATASFLQSRCLSTDPHTVKKLGDIAINTMLSCGITPVIKHIPGHGPATVDSHHELPRIKNIDSTHLIPFMNTPSPWGMTSHLLFTDLDPKNCVTFSRVIIQDVIRGTLEFKGFLITDDVYMGAVSSLSLKERVHRSLEAGHDCALVCHGTLQEWEEAFAGLPPLSQTSLHRLGPLF